MVLSLISSLSGRLMKCIMVSDMYKFETEIYSFGSTYMRRVVTVQNDRVTVHLLPSHRVEVGEPVVP